MLAPGDELRVLARNDFGEPLYATPAVAHDGTLYVRTPTAPYAIGEKWFPGQRTTLTSI